MVSYKFILFFLASCCVYGSMAENQADLHKQTEESIKDTVTDLNWLHSLPKMNSQLTTFIQSNQKLEELASRDHSLVIPKNYQSRLNHESINQLIPNYSGSNLFGGLLPEGRRRLDDDIDNAQSRNIMTKKGEQQLVRAATRNNYLKSSKATKSVKRSKNQQKMKNTVRQPLKASSNSMTRKSSANYQQPRRKAPIEDDIFKNDENEQMSDRRQDSGDSDYDYDEDSPEARPVKRNSRAGTNSYLQDGARHSMRQQQSLNDADDDEEADSSSSVNNISQKKLPRKKQLRLIASIDEHEDASSDEIADASQVKDSPVDLQVAAGHHHGHHSHYYQHVEVPKKKAWKFGFKRGNHKHTIERHEKGYKNKFHSSFKWHAKEKCKKKKKCESVGKMTWHYEHHDKKHHG